MSKNVALLIIDPQVDFHAGGSLSVPKADEDAERIANLIKSKSQFIDNIFVTMDTHNVEHIAHARMWNTKPDGTGMKPSPFQTISYEDIASNSWRFTKPEHQLHVLDYAKQLESKGKFKLIIWPEHCVKDTPGQKVVPIIDEAISAWSMEHPNSPPIYLEKGTHDLTEFYSAIEAEVSILEDETTQTNHAFINALKGYSKVIVCGQARSHCVNYTCRDLVKHWAPRDLKDIIILSDASSSVPGYEDIGNQFMQDMMNLNVTITSSDQVLDVLDL